MDGVDASIEEKHLGLNLIAKLSGLMRLVGTPRARVWVEDKDVCTDVLWAVGQK